MPFSFDIRKSDTKENCRITELLDRTLYEDQGETRADYGIIIFAINNQVHGPVLKEVKKSAPGSNPTYNNADTWEVKFYTGGMVKIRVCMAEKYSASTTYAKNDIVYDDGSDTFYESQQNSNTGNSLSNATYWVEITVSDYIGTWDTHSSNTTSGYVTEEIWHFFDCYLQSCIDELMRKEIVCGCLNDECYFPEYEKRAIDLEGITELFNDGLYERAQEIYEQALEGCKSDIKECDC